MERSAPGFGDINWNRPWLTHVRVLAQLALASGNWRQALNQAADSKKLVNHQGLPIRFVPQASLPPGTAYEAFISETGQIPTRENLHDFFNALIWLTFPKVKAQLNSLQAAELTRTAMEAVSPEQKTSRRGKLRDAATIFDENAAILVTNDSTISDALRNHQWQELFLKRRAAFGRSCEVWLFGHALMEKLVMPYKAITGHTWILEVPDASVYPCALPHTPELLDAALSRAIADGFTTSSFSPLPILGIPNWADGQDEAFYKDRFVFRPKRTESPKLKRV